MHVEPVIAAFLAWLATAAVHGAVLTIAASGLHVVLPRFVRHRRVLAMARERIWKVAIFGGVLTASLSAGGARVWKVSIPLAESPSPAAAPAIIAPIEALLPPNLSAPRAAQRTPAAIQLRWLDGLALVWLAGVAVVTAGWIRDHRRLARLLRGRTRVENGAAHESLQRLLQLVGARRSVVLSRASEISAPITFGILHPEICLPPRAESDLMPGELEAVLAHELAHVRARDPLLLALCRAVEVAFFFQPLVRFARARLLEEIEVRCDERAVRWTGDPVSLASSLTEVATWIVGERRGPYVTAMVGRGSRLERRVRGLLDRGRAQPPARAWVAVPLTFTLAAAPLAVPALAVELPREPASHVGAPRTAPSKTFPSTTPSTIRATSPTITEDPRASADELAASLASLEADYAGLVADSADTDTSDEVRAKIARIELRLNTLRVMRARLDQLLRETPLNER